MVRRRVGSIYFEVSGQCVRVCARVYPCSRRARERTDRAGRSLRIFPKSSSRLGLARSRGRVDDREKTSGAADERIRPFVALLLLLLLLRFVLPSDPSS